MVRDLFIPVCHCSNVGLVSESIQYGRMVVAKRDGGNLHKAVQQSVAVHIADVVAMRLLIVCEEGDGGHLLHGVQLLLELQRFRSRDGGADVDGRLRVMNGILELCLDNLLLGLIGRYGPTYNKIDHLNHFKRQHLLACALERLLLAVLNAFKESEKVLAIPLIGF